MRELGVCGVCEREKGELKTAPWKARRELNKGSSPQKSFTLFCFPHKSPQIINDVIKVVSCVKFLAIVLAFLGILGANEFKEIRKTLLVILT